MRCSRNWAESKKYVHHIQYVRTYRQRENKESHWNKLSVYFLIFNANLLFYRWIHFSLPEFSWFVFGQLKIGRIVVGITQSSPVFVQLCVCSFTLLIFEVSVVCVALLLRCFECWIISHLSATTCRMDHQQQSQHHFHTFKKLHKSPSDATDIRPELKLMKQWDMCPNGLYRLLFLLISHLTNTNEKNK